MYQSNAELPDYVRNALPDSAQSIFLDAYNQSGSFRDAWSKVDRLDDVRWFECWASIERPDTQNEVFSIDGLMEAFPDYIARGGPFHYKHLAYEVGTVYDGERGVHPKTGLPAIKCKGIIYQGKKLYDETWLKMKMGDFPDVSIAGEALKQKWTCDDKKCFNFVEKIDWYDLSTCPSGANKGSIITDLNLKAKSLESLSHLLDAGASGEDLVSKCPVCSRVFNELKGAMPEPDAYLHTKAIAHALTGDVPMETNNPAEGGPKGPVPEPGLVAKADADVADALLQKVLAMFSQVSSKLDNLLSSHQAPEGQAIENAVDGGENPVGESMTEGKEEVPPMDEKPADEVPEAPGEEPKEKEEAPAEAPNEPAPENKPEETPKEDNMPDDENLKKKSDKTPEEKVAEVTEMKAKAEIATSTPRPGIAPQPQETLFHKEFDLRDPGSLRRLARTPARDLIAGKLN